MNTIVNPGNAESTRLRSSHAYVLAATVFVTNVLVVLLRTPLSMLLESYASEPQDVLAMMRWSELIYELILFVPLAAVLLVLSLQYPAGSRVRLKLRLAILFLALGVGLILFARVFPVPFNYLLLAVAFVLYGSFMPLFIEPDDQKVFKSVVFYVLFLSANMALPIYGLMLQSGGDNAYVSRTLPILSIASTWLNLAVLTLGYVAVGNALGRLEREAPTSQARPNVGPRG